MSAVYVCPVEGCSIGDCPACQRIAALQEQEIIWQVTRVANRELCAKNERLQQDATQAADNFDMMVKTWGEEKAEKERLQQERNGLAFRTRHLEAENALLVEAGKNLGVENAELRASRDAWKAFAEHQEYCRHCSEWVSGCETGSDLRTIARGTEDE